MNGTCSDSKETVKQVRNCEGHYPECVWSNPQTTCGPDTCRCVLEQLRIMHTITSTTSDTGSDNSNASIKCINCRCHVINIEKILNSVLRLCDSIMMIIDKCK